MNGKDISVIIQGAITDKDNTIRCIQSIRQQLPDAEIILSTWKGADVKNLLVDKLILSDDPGALVYKTKTDNTNRQIVSTISGLRHASRRYSLKIRSDSVLESNAFLENFSTKYPKRNQKYSIFNERITTCTLFTKKFLDRYSKIPTPFHISDWFHLGCTSDLQYLWDIPLISEKKYLKVNLGIQFLYKDLWIFSRYAPEQYIFLMAAKKRFYDIEFDNMLNFNTRTIEFSKALIVNNFFVIPPKRLGYSLLKEPYRTEVENCSNFIDESYINDSDYDFYYNKYCN